MESLPLDVNGRPSQVSRNGQHSNEDVLHMPTTMIFVHGGVLVLVGERGGP